MKPYDEESLFDLAREYVAVIAEIERTGDPAKLEALDERRIEVHSRFMDMLNRQGIKFKDRDHATRIAMRIANEEL